MPELDDQIRSLVASAVDDAPPAPPLPAPSTARRNRRWIGATAGFAALVAAAVGGNALLQPADNNQVVTKNNPTPTTSTTVATVAERRSFIVVAGPDGITWQEKTEGGFDVVSGGSRVTSEPMAFALALGDGRFIAQRSTDYESDPAATVPLLVAADGTITELMPTANFAGRVNLHDFSVVDGRRLLLYSVYVAGDMESTRETLYAYDIDEGDSMTLAVIGAWESGTARLHLGSNGLVVGTAYAEATHSFLARAIPGSDAAKRPLPKAKDFGLEEDYTDCACPIGYVIDPAGENLYWLAPNGEGQRGGVIRTSPIATPSPTTIGPIPNYDGEYVGGIRIDISDRGVLFSSGIGEDSSKPFFRRSDGGVDQLTGTYATVGPNG